MAQQIKQEVLVDVTVKGGEAAAKTLESIDAKIKSIKQNARGLSSALSSMNKVNGSGKINASLGSIDTGGTANLQSSMRAVQTATSKAGAAAKTATPLFSKLKASLDASSESAKSASWNFFRTRAAIAAVAMVVGTLGLGAKKWFDMASDYAEANHLFYTTLASSLSDVAEAEKTATIQGKDLFGNLTGDSVAVTPAVAAAAEEVERMAKAMMLDPTQMKRTYATFYEMANSAGMATDKVMKLSQGMTQLTYDLSSLWDKPFDETASKLQSGISGISTAVKSYGIDISRTAADQWLLSNGINSTYNELDRANKMIVMYNMLMEHTTTAQGDLARSALQPANMFRILGAQASVAGRMLGAAVFPVVTKLIPLFIMLAQAIQRAAAVLASFLGKKLGSWYTESQDQWNSYLSNLNGSFGRVDVGADEMEDDLGNVGDAAQDTASKLKEITDFTLPFDELHILPDTPTAGGGGGGGGGGAPGGGGGIDIPMLDPYPWEDQLTDVLLGDAAKTLDILKKKIDDIFDPGTFDAFMRATSKMWKTVKRDTAQVVDAIRRVGQAFDESWDWVDFLDAFAEGFTNASDVITGAITSILNAVPGLKDFLENLPIVGDMFKGLFDNMDSGLGYVLGVMLAFKGVSGALKILGKVLSPVLKLFQTIFTPISKVAGAIKNIISPAGKAAGGVSKLGDAFVGAAGVGKLGKFVSKIGKAFGPVGIVLAIADGLRSIATDILPKGLDRWSKVFESKDPIGTYFEQMKDYVASGDWINNILNLVLWEGALDDLAGWFQNAADAAWNFGKSIGESLTPVFSTIGQKMVEAGATIYDAVTGVFIAIGDKIVGILNILGIDVGDQWTAMKDSIKLTSDQIHSIAENGFKGISESVNRNTREAKEAAVNNFNQTRESGQSAFSILGSAISSAMGSVKSNVTNNSAQMQVNSSNSFNRTEANGRQAFNNLEWGISQKMAAARRNTDWEAASIQRAFNFEWRMPRLKLPHFNWSTRTIGGFTFPIFGGIDWYAKGGIFDSATIAGIGEAGPEAVVPLQGARMRPFAEAVASNIHNSNDGSYNGSASLDGDALVAAISTSVYNAMVQGFPKEIKTDVSLDGVKVNKELDRIKRQQGVGTSLVSAV